MSTVVDDATVPLCQDCGACCLGGGERYVRVTGDDHARLGPKASQWTTFIGHRCYMRMDDGRCAALHREPGTNRLLCGIYPWRPQVCRDLERGGSACAAERLRKQQLADGHRRGSPSVD